MNQDGVSVALELMFDEISAVHRQMTDEMTQAFAADRHDEAGRILESAKRLFAFRSQLQQLRKDWESGIDVETRERVRVASARSITASPKGRKTKLRVITPSGRTIFRSFAADTFADVVEDLGLDAVERLGIALNDGPLVRTSRSAKYHQAQRGKYFVMTHSSTGKKKELLDEIAGRLGRTITVEIV
ncbi:MAG: hypothetical protein C0506_02085 [Anaerolinea sp.]|nr:hypothetical protein [Anaerolinea sp.]